MAKVKIRSLAELKAEMLAVARGEIPAPADAAQMIFESEAAYESWRARQDKQTKQTKQDPPSE